MRVWLPILLAAVAAFGLARSANAQMGVTTTLPLNAAANPIVRVLLDHSLSNTNRLYISASGPFTLKDALGNLVASGTSASMFSVSWEAASGPTVTPGLKAIDTAFGPQNSTDDSDEAPEIIKVDPVNPADGVLLASTPTGKGCLYRGSIAVVALSSGLLRVVNSLHLEDYVRGVVRVEIGGSAPIEAMKAQAVAARTYAVRNIGRLWQEGADIDDTTRCQSYMGKNAECNNADLAVAQTSGQVLIYDGSVIDALYCTDCGGVTAVGPADEPYLSPVIDAECALKPRWSYKISRIQLNAMLNQDASHGVGDLKRIEIDKTDASGRAADIKLIGDVSERTIGGDAFRLLLGPDNLRSTLFKVKSDHDDDWVFSGQGWGHGLGMCQAGAIARASGPNPETYTQILSDYYPGTQLTLLTTVLVPSQPLITHIATVSQR